jgi:hypothetical protein
MRLFCQPFTERVPCFLRKYFSPNEVSHDYYWVSLSILDGNVYGPIILFEIQYYFVYSAPVRCCLLSWQIDQFSLLVR